MPTKKKAVKPAPNPTVKYAKLTLDGETYYSLCFSFNAIAIAEQEAGVNLLKALDNLEDLSAAQFRGLLYAALTKAHPDMTLDDAGELVRLDTIPVISRALGQAYLNSLPERKQDENPPEPSEAA